MQQNKRTEYNNHLVNFTNDHMPKNAPNWVCNHSSLSWLSPVILELRKELCQSSCLLNDGYPLPSSGFYWKNLADTSSKSSRHYLAKSSPQVAEYPRSRESSADLSWQPLLVCYPGLLECYEVLLARQSQSSIPGHNQDPAGVKVARISSYACLCLFVWLLEPCFCIFLFSQLWSWHVWALLSCQLLRCVGTEVNSQSYPAIHWNKSIEYHFYLWSEYRWEANFSLIMNNSRL